MLVIGVTAPLVAYLSKRFEERTLMVGALGSFLVGAALDIVAPNFVVLFVGRVLQALAAGIVLPVMQNIAMTRFPSNQSASAMGIAGIALGLAPNVGPTVGGALVDTLGWRSYFVIAAAIAVALLVVTLVVFDHKKTVEVATRFSTSSLVLSTLGFGGLLLAFTNASNMAVSEPAVWVSFVVGVVALVAFFVVQRRLANPLINLDIFKTPSYTFSMVAQCAFFMSYMGITLILPLFIQNVSHQSALLSGEVFIPNIILAMIINPVAGIMCDRVGARKVCLVGATLLFVGALPFVFVDEATPFWWLMVCQTVRGAGVSTLVAPLISFGLSGLPGSLVVDGSSFFTTLRMAFASFGTAFMMIAISAFGGGGSASGAGASAVSTAASSAAATSTASAALGYQIAFGISAAAALVVLVCVVTKIKD
jgi:EmrB/QacA subfamily drug resistance transporter